MKLGDQLCRRRGVNGRGYLVVNGAGNPAQQAPALSGRCGHGERIIIGAEQFGGADAGDGQAPGDAFDTMVDVVVELRGDALQGELRRFTDPPCAIDQASRYRDRRSEFGRNPAIMAKCCLGRTGGWLGHAGCPSKCFTLAS